MSPTPANTDLLRGSVWGYRFVVEVDPKPAVIVSNDARNRSRFEWVHVVRITTRPKQPLPTIVELGEADQPNEGRVMCDDLEIVHKKDLEDRRGRLSARTMSAVDRALKIVLDLD